MEQQILISIIWLEVLAVGNLLIHLIKVLRNEPKGALWNWPSPISSIEKDFKDYLEKKLDEARTSLMCQDAIQPLFITWGMLGAKDTPICLNEKDIEATSIMMQEVCTSPAVQMAAIVVDSYIYSTESEKAEKMREDHISIKDLEGTREVLVILLYNKGKLLKRSIPYKKIGELDYWFADAGWEVETETTGLYASLFPA